MKKNIILVIIVLLLSFSNVTNSAMISDHVASADIGQSIADYACQFIGNPYVWGGTSLTNGADCSGFAYAVMDYFGINLMRVANDQFNNGTVIDFEDRQPGDLIFYGYGDSYADHTTIYIGNDQIVHAKSSDEGIVISDVNYWNYIGVRRYW